MYNLEYRGKLQFYLDYCSIFKVFQTQQPITQLIAHDKEVYDIAFGRDKDTFASVGADGSVRTFDIR